MTLLNHRGMGVFLGISGIIGLVIGLGTLFIPDQFHASADIVLGDSASLRSEIRAPGAMLALISLGILTSIFITSWRYIALIATAVLYMAYGLARIFSIGVDGMPGGTLVAAMAVELIIGSIAVFLIYRHHS